MKKLYRSDTDKVIAGVFGGVGIYTSVDPVALRVLWVLLGVVTGVFPAILAYVIAALIIPPASSASRVVEVEDAHEEENA